MTTKKALTPERKAERNAYDILRKAYQDLEVAIDELEAINPESEDLSTLKDYLKNME